MDNASVMYSALQKEEYSAIYRFSAVMSAPVDTAAFQRAIDRTMPRFPGFAVRIKAGFFWYYYEPNNAPGPFIREDMAEPCRPLRFAEDDGWLVRFYYYGSRVSLEVFHAVADGFGAMTFFRTVLAQYLREKGVEVPSGNGILDLGEAPQREEWEDAYARYAGKVTRKQPLVRRAYQNRGTSEPFYTFNVTMGFVPVDAIKSRAKARGVSISEYMSAVLIYVIMEKQKRGHFLREKPVALAVPVNLRAYYPSRTLRNFILTIQPWIDPAVGDYSFDEIASLTHHYMRTHSAPQETRAAFTRNVRFQANRFLQIIPRFVKNPIMAFSYMTRGLRPYSATMTNPGIFTVPDEMRPYIDHMEVIQGQATVPRPHLSSISYGDTLEITFSGTQRETDTEREFFRFLVRDGIPVRIESNRHRHKTGGEEES